MIKKRYNLVILLILVFSLTYCGSLPKTKKDYVNASYRALAVSGNSYDLAMSSIAKLYKEGHIGSKEKESALNMATYYYTAYHAAVEALQAYAAGDMEDQGYLQIKLMAVGRSLGNLLGYLNPILKKYGLEMIE